MAEFTISQHFPPSRKGMSGRCPRSGLDWIVQIDGSARSAGPSPTFTPPALALILKDCATWRIPDLTEKHGAIFWRNRQAGLLMKTFPPQTVSLDADGKVVLS